LQDVEWVSRTALLTRFRPHTLQPADQHTDLFINICLTVLGVLPGHLHAFYLMWVYYDRREQAREGRYAARPAPGVYSSHVQTGGGHNYGTVNHPPANYGPAH
jgi:hypothetical protein